MAEGEGGFAVTLDGRPLRTPARAALVLPSRPLAEAIAGEWAAQDGEVRPDAMTLTRIATTAIDRVSNRRAEVVGEVAGYGASDLLCHRAEAPPELVTRQEEAWQPLLDWAAAELGAELANTTGVIPVRQPDAARAACRVAVEALDDMALAALALAVAATGSLVLGLALAAGRIDAEAAWGLSQLDEDFQSERWGRDEEAGHQRQATRADIEAAARFLTLLRG